MRSSERDFSRAVAGALVLAAAVMLVVLLRIPGLILSLLLLAVDPATVQKPMDRPVLYDDPADAPDTAGGGSSGGSSTP